MTPQIQGINELLSKLKSLPGDITKKIDFELRDGAQSIAAEAKQRAPADQGILRNEIGTEQKAPMNYEVFSGAEYSPFVEFGTLTKVNIPAGLEEYAAQFKGGGHLIGGSLSLKQAIFNWCERKGIDKSAWYAIYISIAVNGIRPHPFFFPAVTRQSPIIVDRVKKALL